MNFAEDSSATSPADSAATLRYNTFLLLVAGLGGLLYGIDVGIIGGAVPYLQATSGLNPSQLSFIVAAVLLGSVFSTLFSGLLADWMGRKPLMIASGCAFVVSIPVIALSQGYGPLLFGRLLQGASGGVIGVVVPLYLAECLAASSRGKGTAIFQWMLTLGIVAAALMGMYFSYQRGRGGQAGRCGGALPLQGSSMAKHLLGVAAARCCVRTGQLVCYGVAAVAFSAGTKGSRERCSAQVAQPRAGRAGTCRDGGDGACAEERGRRFASRCCGGSTRFHFCWPA